MSAQSPKPATQLIHGDQHLSGNGREVAPSISVTTTFRSQEFKGTSLSGGDTGIQFREPQYHVYSRYTQQVSTRAEHVLSKVNQGFAITYSSGLAAAFAALVYYKPKRVAITGGYHGCHMTLSIYKKSNPTLEIIGVDDEFKQGDFCWIETPLNPTGESRSIAYYADKVHAVGGKLMVDSTFGPPPLQYPFKWGADCIMHSGTKYFGGHSDMLCGILVVKSEDEWKELQIDRTYMGNMMGSLESWLLLRSLRTLGLRVQRQSETATALVRWLDAVASTPAGKEYDGVPGGVLTQVFHSSLQPVTADFDASKQMEGGWGATFAIKLAKPEQAAALPHTVKYLVPATSLGGVESLIEYRLQSDPTADPHLIRLSIGLEDIEDLKEDLRNALRTVGSKLSAKL